MSSGINTKFSSWLEFIWKFQKPRVDSSFNSSETDLYEFGLIWNRYEFLWVTISWKHWAQTKHSEWKNSPLHWRTLSSLVKRSPHAAQRLFSNSGGCILFWTSFSSLISCLSFLVSRVPQQVLLSHSSAGGLIKEAALGFTVSSWVQAYTPSSQREKKKSSERARLSAAFFALARNTHSLKLGDRSSV